MQLNCDNATSALHVCTHDSAMAIQLSKPVREQLLAVLDRITGWQTRTAAQLKGKYSRDYVRMVALGQRYNEEILEALLDMAEKHREKERRAAERIKELSRP